MTAPTHADGMLFMEYYKLWDTALDGEAWTSPRAAWDGVATAIAGLRETNPEAYVNFEWLAERYDEWLAAR